MNYLRIKEAHQQTSHVVRLEDGRVFTRYGPDSWMEHKADCLECERRLEEWVYDCGWLEAAWRER